MKRYRQGCVQSINQGSKRPYGQETATARLAQGVGARQKPARGGGEPGGGGNWQGRTVKVPGRITYRGGGNYNQKVQATRCAEGVWHGRRKRCERHNWRVTNCGAANKVLTRRQVRYKVPRGMGVRQ